jgi:predicted CXXCH cytochrome family protein
MIRFGLTLAFLAIGTIAFGQDNCLDCHRELEDEDYSYPALAMRDDVHAQARVSCVDCHGGDAEVEIVDGDYDPAMDPAKGFIGVPDAEDIPRLCGRCHSDASFMHEFDPNISVDQLTQYWTSVHGEKLREGASDVAHCASCHHAHGVLSSKDPRSPVYPTRIPETCGTCHADPEHMKEYGIPTDQLSKYRDSVHGRALFDQGDLGAPTCNSCHGNHGAAPPGVASLSAVCGNCHSIQKELFSASPHEEAFDALDEPECESCHGNHDVEAPSDDLVGVGEDSICMACHDEGEPAYEVAETMHTEMSNLKEAMAAAREVVDRAGRAGMEVSEAEVALIDANQTLVQARNLVHAFAAEPLQEQVKDGLAIATTAQEMGIAALAELDYRRKGLAASVFFIALIVVGLYLKIRQIEGKG